MADFRLDGSNNINERQDMIDQFYNLLPLFNLHRRSIPQYPQGSCSNEGRDRIQRTSCRTPSQCQRRQQQLWTDNSQETKDHRQEGQDPYCLYYQTQSIRSFQGKTRMAMSRAVSSRSMTMPAASPSWTTQMQTQTENVEHILCLDSHGATRLQSSNGFSKY